jgi:DNA repair protein RecO
MKRFRSQGIILNRTDFGEADRIMSFLTLEHGKVRGIAKGVKKPKSKLAAGIELFSICDLSFLVGKSEIYTILSTRLDKHYGNIVKEVTRVNTGYELIKLMDKATADAPEADYFNLLKAGLEALDDLSLEPQITALWFNMQMLKLTGHAPNLYTDTRGAKLKTSGTYNFHMDRMHFTPELAEKGAYSANHIKFLRLGFSAARPHVLQRVEKVKNLADSAQPLIQTMLQSYVRV